MAQDQVGAIIEAGPSEWQIVQQDVLSLSFVDPRSG